MDRRRGAQGPAEPLPRPRKGGRGNRRDGTERSRGSARSRGRAGTRSRAPGSRAQGPRAHRDGTAPEGILAASSRPRPEGARAEGRNRRARGAGVRFWDTSALVPLCVSEPASRKVRRLATADPSLVVWWGTRTECLSAFARGRRDGKLAAAVEQRARRVLASLAAEWSEVLPTDAVRDRAERLLGVHPLRAADAFH